MTPRSRSRRAGSAFGVAVVCAVVLAGCTEGSGEPSSPTPKQSAPASSAEPRGESEKKLGRQAEAALDTVTIDDPEFVESGLETLGDGVHTEALLTRGKPYRLGVSCAGEGEAELSIHIDGKPVVRRFDCDGTATYERITDAPARLAVDVEKKPGSTGMVAWSISEA